jgi:(2Fe-2S) ferredoxin
LSFRAHRKREGCSSRPGYGDVTEDKIEEIMDALEEGKAVDEYLIA